MVRLWIIVTFDEFAIFLMTYCKKFEFLLHGLLKAILKFNFFAINRLKTFPQFTLTKNVSRLTHFFSKAVSKNFSHYITFQLYRFHNIQIIILISVPNKNKLSIKINLFFSLFVLYFLFHTQKGERIINKFCRH